MIANDDDTRTLFIGDLAIYCTENDLENLFSQFGPIEKVTLKRGLSGTTNLSYGFVKFLHRESAEAATSLKGYMFMGRAIRIGRAGPRVTDKPLKPKEGPSRRDTAQIHVSFISKQIDALITEETLRSLFSHYGQVVDVAIKKSKFDHNLKIQNGYGFIHFPLTSEGIQAAITATREVHQITVDRVIYDCTLSHLLESYLTPEQIAFAYSSPTPPAFKGRPYERKREMYYRKEMTIPPLYHHHHPATTADREQLPSSSLLFGSPITSFTSTTAFDESSHSSQSSSSGAMSHLSSWESAAFASILGGASSSSQQLTGSPAEESRLFQFESPLATSPEKLDLSKLLGLGLPEPASPQTSTATSALSDCFPEEDLSIPRLPLAFPSLQDLSNERFFTSTSSFSDGFNSDFFTSWTQR